MESRVQGIGHHDPEYACRLRYHQIFHVLYQGQGRGHQEPCVRESRSTLSTSASKSKSTAILTSVVILTTDPVAAHTQKCLQLLRDNTAMEYELLLLRDERRRYAFAKENNRMIRVAEGRYIILLNDDCYVPGGWLERMVEAAESDPAVGIVGGLPSSRPELISFALVLIRREVFEKIGLLDERFTHGYEDHEFCQRALAAGFKVVSLDMGAIHPSDTSSKNPRYFAKQLRGLVILRRMQGKGLRKVYRDVFWSLTYELRRPVVIWLRKRSSDSANPQHPIH
jgi:hypothetical protein